MQEQHIIPKALETQGFRDFYALSKATPNALLTHFYFCISANLLYPLRGTFLYPRFARIKKKKYSKIKDLVFLKQGLFSFLFPSPLPLFRRSFPLFSLSQKRKKRRRRKALYFLSSSLFLLLFGEEDFPFLFLFSLFQKKKKKKKKREEKLPRIEMHPKSQTLLGCISSVGGYYFLFCDLDQHSAV